MTTAARTGEALVVDWGPGAPEVVTAGTRTEAPVARGPRPMPPVTVITVPAPALVVDRVDRGAGLCPADRWIRAGLLVDWVGRGPEGPGR